MHTYHNARAMFVQCTSFAHLLQKASLPFPLFAFGFQCSIPRNADNEVRRPVHSNSKLEPSHKLRAVVLYNDAQGKERSRWSLSALVGFHNRRKSQRLWHVVIGGCASYIEIAIGTPALRQSRFSQSQTG